MRNQRNQFRVRVHTKDGPEIGTLIWDEKGPTVKTPLEAYSEKDDVFYDIDGELIPGISGSPKSEIEEPIATVGLHPLLKVNRRFSYDQSIKLNQVYPPASHNWTSRIGPGGENVLITIQPTSDTSRYWLTVYSIELGEVLESHLIFRYEVGAIGLIRDSEADEVRRAAVAPKSLEKMREDILTVLDEPSPS